VRVEEMMNFRRKEVNNKLKPLLCTPPETVSVNTKNVKQYDIPNTQNWVMFSNHEDAIPIEATDRRYCVLRCLLESPRPRSYYTDLHNWYDAGGCEKVAGWLLQRDLSAFDPMATPPMTEAKRQMFAQTLPAQVRWACEALTEGEFAGRTVIVARELIAAANAAAFDGAPGGVSDKHVAAALKNEGFKLHRVKIGSVAERLWARGDALELSPDQLRDRYLSEQRRSDDRRMAA
jgi:hypothetical protein